MFEHVKAINPYKFFLVLVKSDTQYSLYKQFVTKYVEANLRNDGVIQTGHEYNEYKDASQYFIVQQSTGTSKNISLKSKAIKAALEGNEEKVDAYFREHKGNVDEQFLVDLITYLNR
jgi:cystathionine beta-lyase family protein involved in aluminum resistance